MAARTVEERIAIIDEKISKKKADIKVLEAQKQKLLHPVTMKTVMEKAKACAYCGARLIVLRRPRENGETVESILERCRELL